MHLGPLRSFHLIGVGAATGGYYYHTVGTPAAILCGSHGIFQDVESFKIGRVDALEILRGDLDTIHNVKGLGRTQYRTFTADGNVGG